MANLVTLATNAIQAKMVQATVAERTPNGITFEVGKNQFALECSVAPIYHYLKDGSWVEVDTDVEDSDVAGFSDRFSRSSYIAYVSPYGSRRIYPDRNDLSNYLDIGRVQLVGASKASDLAVASRTKAATDNLAYVGDAYTVNIINTGCQIKWQITVRDEKVAGQFERIAFPLTLFGLKYEKGNITDGKTTLAQIDQGILWDANRTTRTFPVTYIDGLLIMEPDLSDLVYPIVIDPTVDFQVGANADDGWTNKNETFYSNFGSCWVGHDPGTVSTERAFHRFLSVGVPKAATVSNCYFSVRALGRSGSALTIITANDVDDAVAPTSTAEYNDLIHTSASVNWDPPAWSSGTWYDSPDISSVIQEIVNRAGWASGNDLMILHGDRAGTGTNDIQYYEYSGGATNAAKLYIEYTEGGSGGTSFYTGPYRSLLGVGR